MPALTLVVWAGGRWRAVDAGGGGALRVVRRGRLEPLRRRLRPDAVTLGPALPYKYRKPQAGSSASSDSEQLPEPSRTRHTHHKRTHKAASLTRASVAVQCGGQHERGGVPRGGSKRKRSTSSEPPDPESRTITTLASVHANQHTPKKTKTDSLHLNRKRSSMSSEDSPQKTSPKKSLSLKRKLGPLKRKRPSREGSPILQPKISRLSENRTSETLQHRQLLKQHDSSSHDTIPARTKRQIVSLISSDESDFETIQKNKLNIKSSSHDKPVKLGPNRTQKSSTEPVQKPKRAGDSSSTDELNPRTKGSDEPVRRKLRPKRTVDKSSRNEPVNTDPKKSQTSSSTDNTRMKVQKDKEGSKRVIDSGTTNKPGSEKCVKSRSELMSQAEESTKELVIDERDVELIRLFLQKNYPDEELLKFDTDEEYKLMYFYRINPLVKLERCPRIQRMLRASSQRSLLHFASQLGLRSVSEASSTKRYRTRRSQRKSSSEDKENIDKPAPASKTVRTDKVLRETVNRGLNRAGGKKEKKVETKKATDGTVEIAVREDVKKVQPMKPKVISSKRAGCKEYSNLEDHAIVAWVSTDSRASRVNGNRLWRQLQEQYPRLTGIGRTWHSLRNRYLRYILPRLPRLSLPPAHQARLRAAAATGELKARKKEPTRKPMFPPTPRGAFSRRQRPFPFAVSSPHDGADHAGGELSPRRPLTERSAERLPERSAAKRNGELSPRRPLTERSAERLPERSAAKRNGELSPRRPLTERSAGDSSRRSARARSPAESSTGSSSSDESPARRPTSARRNVRTEADPRSSNRRDSTSDTNTSNSPVDSNRRQSNRLNSTNEINRQKSNRPNPMSDSNRRNSPVDSNRRQSNRLNSSNNLNRRNSPVESNRRKSSRPNSTNETSGRKSNRHNSTSYLNRRNSPVESNKRNSPVESYRRNSSSDSSSSSSAPAPSTAPTRARRRAPPQPPSPLPRGKTSPTRPPRLRKLYNHRAVF